MGTCYVSVMSKPSDDNYEFQKVIAIVGVGLLLIKFFAYSLTGSVAILTDAMESIVNVVAAFVGLFALYISAQPADKTHPFGHGKVELISATIEGTMIVVAGALIIGKSVDSFLHPGEIAELDVGIILIVGAALVNYVTGRIAIRRGNRNRSPALVASGKHLCSDTYSSVGITIGLVIVYVAMYMGYDARWLDSSIAVLFGLIIAVTGIRVIKKCMDDVMDKADTELIKGVTKSINKYRHEDWIDIYRMRMIKYGPKIFVDIHVVFPKEMTVERILEEKRELDDAISKQYGDSVEVSMTPMPCREFNCFNCAREDCPNRKAPFRSRIAWSTRAVSTYNPHALGNMVVIHIDDDE